MYKIVLMHEKSKLFKIEENSIMNAIYWPPIFINEQHAITAALSMSLST